jgi:predicted nucleic acid-binding protein
LQSSLALLPRAYELSSQMRIGVYDCLYVALAEREQCELVTADQRLVTVFAGLPIVALSTL